jgi:hypothetical protein
MSRGGTRRDSRGQLDLDPAHVVFIDETWATTNMARIVAGRRNASGCAPLLRMAAGRQPPQTTKFHPPHPQKDGLLVSGAVITCRDRRESSGH